MPAIWFRWNQKEERCHAAAPPPVRQAMEAGRDLTVTLTPPSVELVKGATPRGCVITAHDADNAAEPFCVIAVLGRSTSNLSNERQRYRG